MSEKNADPLIDRFHCGGMRDRNWEFSTLTLTGDGVIVQETCWSGGGLFAQSKGHKSNDELGEMDLSRRECGGLIQSYFWTMVAGGVTSDVAGLKHSFYVTQSGTLGRGIKVGWGVRGWNDGVCKTHLQLRKCDEIRPFCLGMNILWELRVGWNATRSKGQKIRRKGFPVPGNCARRGWKNPNAMIDDC